MQEKIGLLMEVAAEEKEFLKQPLTAKQNGFLQSGRLREWSLRERVECNLIAPSD